VLFATLAGQPAPATHVARTHRPARAGLLTLPLAAQAPVSAALGATGTTYRVEASAGVLSATNPAQRLSGRFSASGLLVSSGATRVGLSLREIGYGSAVRQIGEVVPRAAGNRVVYEHRGVSEWYVNGPLGLEQGFAIAGHGRVSSAAPLTLTLALSGNARAALDRTGRSVAFIRAGSPTLRYTGLTATDATGRVLHSWLTLQRGTLQLHVDANGARLPLRIDPFVQQAHFGEGQGSFGYSVALSAEGNTALVGGPIGSGNIGEVWAFTRTGSTWTHQGESFTGSGETGESHFGYSVALSSNGTTALIGGYGDNSSTGAAWVFTRSGETWIQQGAKLTGAEEEGHAKFGWSVSLSANGNTALIGGPGDEHGARVGGEEIGAAWVFARSGEKWTQQGAKLEGAGEFEEGGFGWSVALSGEGTTALIGAPLEETGGSAGDGEVGSAYVFTRSGETWTQQGGALTGSGEAGEGGLGTSVALSSNGSTALIGAPRDGNVGLSLEYIGAVFAFTRSGSTWSQQGSKLTGGGESGYGGFGASVALSPSGYTALIGAPNDNKKAGAVWSFTRSGEIWSQEGAKLTGGKDELPSGRFGYTVALSTNTALVGAPQEGSDEGDVLMYVTGPSGTPTAATEPTPSTATLNATVNPNGEEVTSCEFEYGTTTSYGSSVPCSTKPGSGASPVAVSAPVTGLKENTTYHFRITATNATGKTDSTDQTFTTLASSASASTSEEKKPAEASDGELSAKASGGTGTITVGKYGSDPGGPHLLGTDKKYVDVYKTTQSSFSTVETEDCELNGAKTLYWYDSQANENKGEWEEVTPQTYVPGPPACIKTEAKASGTSPTVAQLAGTRFGAATKIDPPEFALCAAAETNKEGTKTVYAGLFTASTCLAKSEGPNGLPEGKYELEVEVLQKSPFSTKATAVTLESSASGSKMACTGEASGGEYTGQRTIGGIELTLTGCAQGGEKCASPGESGGEVASKALEGTLGIEEKGSTAAKDKIGLELTPTVKSGAFMEYSCGTTSVTVRGSVIGTVKPNKASAAQSVKFGAKKGMQKPEDFEGASKTVLEESIDGAAYQQTGLTATITQTNGTKVEINSVF
jgi:hypothetical protein